MKKKILILLFFINYSYSQKTNHLTFRYDYTGKSHITVINSQYDFIYKGTTNSIFKFKKKYKNSKLNNDHYLFTEHCNDKSYASDFYISEKKNVLDAINNSKHLEFDYLPMCNYDSIKKYKIISKYKDLKISELYYEINDSIYLKIITNNRNQKEEIENKIVIGLEKALSDNKEKPNAFFKLLDTVLHKDYNAQLNYIKAFDKEKYTTESLFGSILVDLHTNNGSFDEVRKLISKRKKIPIQKNDLNDVEDYISKISDSIDVFMFNEFHSYPHTRFNFMFALNILKEKGFQYLALETLPPPNNNDGLFTKIEDISGYYVEEPTCSLMINYAASLGYKLIPYEEGNQCIELKGLDSSNCRDSIQAINIAKIYDYDEHAKVLVFGGHAHIEKKTRDDWKFMRVVLQEMFPNKKIHSIGQTKYIRTNLDSIDIPMKKPLIYSKNDSQFDANLISPFYAKYYEWYYTPSEFMTKKIIIPKNKDFFSVEIIPILKNIEIYYPIFRSTKQNLQGFTIYLPENIKYKVIYKDKNNKRI